MHSKTRGKIYVDFYIGINSFLGNNECSISWYLLNNVAFLCFYPIVLNLYRDIIKILLIVGKYRYYIHLKNT